MDLDGESAYLFRHALLRSAALELQLPSARARLHALALATMEERFPEAADQASWAVEFLAHAEAALAGPDQPPEQIAQLTSARLKYLGLAAGHAFFGHQLREAVRLLDQFAQALPPSTTRCDARIKLAKALTELGRHKEALAALKLARQTADEIGAVASRESCIVETMNIHYTLQDAAAIEELLPTIKSLGDHAESPAIRAAALQIYGAVFEARGVLDEALEARKRAIAAAQLTDSPRTIARALDNLGISQTAAGELDQAEKTFNSALTEMQKTGDDWFIGRNLLLCAFHRRVAGRFHEAAPLYERAANALRRCGNLQDLGWALCDAGGLQHQMGRLVEAEALYIEAIEIDLEVAAAMPWAVASGNLALCYVERGLFEEAKPLFDRVVDWSRRGTGYKLGNTLTNRAILESDMGNFDESLQTTEEALSLSGGDPMFQAINYGNRGRLHFLTGNLTQARLDLEHAIVRLTDLKLPYFEGCYRAELGHMMLALVDLQADEQLDAAAALMDRVGNRREWAGRLAPALARRAVQQGDLAAALAFLAAADEILDAAGITPAAWSKRQVNELRECIAAARSGGALFRGFRLEALDERLRRALVQR